MSKFSNNTTTLRKHYNLTQEDVASHLNVTRAGYSMYERGEREPSIDKLIQLADLFQVTIDYLVGRDVIEDSKTMQNIITMKNIDRNLEIATKDIIEQFIQDNENEIKNLIMERIDTQ